MEETPFGYEELLLMNILKTNLSADKGRWSQHFSPKMYVIRYKTLRRSLELDGWAEAI